MAFAALVQVTKSDWHKLDMYRAPQDTKRQCNPHEKYARMPNAG